MRESITIKNFGPIKDVTIDNTTPFTVFIGESGSGKSTIMKVLVLFRWIYKMLNIRSYLKYANVSDTFSPFNFKDLLKGNGLISYIDKAENVTPEIIYKRGETTIHYKKKLSTTPMVPKEELSLEKMCFISDKRNLIPDILSGHNTDMSFYLNETYNDFDISAKDIERLELDYLSIRYSHEKTNFGVKHYIGSIDKYGGYKIPFEEASSGIQTATPLSVIVEHFSKHYSFSKQFNNIVFDYLSKGDSLKDFRSGQNIGDIKNMNIHLHIEEPELSLYPESQRSLINFIVNRCFIGRDKGYDMTVMLATHSPYIINHLNLLVKAYDKGKLIEGAKLNYDDVSVYQVADGTIEDLKIPGTRLIDTNPLSETIDDIYNAYNDLD